MFILDGMSPLGGLKNAAPAAGVKATNEVAPATGKNPNKDKVDKFVETREDENPLTVTDRKTGHKISETYHFNNGNRKAKTEYDPKTGHMKKVTNYFNDGQRVKSMDKYDPKTGQMKSSTSFNENGLILSIKEYATTGKMESETFYKDGRTIDSIHRYDPNTGKRISE